MSAAPISTSSDSPPRAHDGLLRAVRQLGARLSVRRKCQALAIIGIALASAAVETLSLGALIPLLAALNDAQMLLDNPFIGPYLAAYDFEDPVALVYLATSVFVSLVVAAALIRMALTWALNRWVFGVGYDFGMRVFGAIMRQPYEYYITTPTRDIILGLDRISTVCNSVLRPLLQGVASAIIALCIFLALVWVEPVSALAAMGGFVTIYLITAYTVRVKLMRNSGLLVEAQRERIGLVQEGLGNIRDVILDDSSKVYLKQFRRVDGLWRTCQATNQILGEIPRFIIEAIGMILIVAIALALWTREGGLAGALPLLAALALGARKLVPELQRVYNGWTKALGSVVAVYRVLGLLDLPSAQAVADDAIEFEQRIDLRAVAYHYPGTASRALHGVDLYIRRGERFGIVGPSGSGKSTLIDVLMGLLLPTTGELLVDGEPVTTRNIVAWRAKIAHVPQNVFLIDASIAENIALGERSENIDMARLQDVVERAMLDDLVRSRPEGVWSTVGERGARLSGGQAQRVAIARALYKRASVLVLDEATSALDRSTEQAIVQCLERLGDEITVVMIAHRLSTLSPCGRIVELKDGRVAGETDFHTLSSANGAVH